MTEQERRELLSAQAGRARLAEKVGPLALALAEANETIETIRAERDAALAKLAVAMQEKPNDHDHLPA